MPLYLVTGIILVGKHLQRKTRPGTEGSTKVLQTPVANWGCGAAGHTKRRFPREGGNKPWHREVMVATERTTRVGTVTATCQACQVRILVRLAPDCLGTVFMTQFLTTI